MADTHSPSPRRLPAVFAWLLVAGCGSDSTPSEAAAAGSNAVLAADSRAEPSLMALIAAFVAETDRQVELNCPCFVEMGAYKTVEECVHWQHSGPEWVPCSTRVLTPYDSPETREVFRCMANLVREGGACAAAKGCDPVARAECGGSPLQCVGEHVDLGLALLNGCPDVALLSRQR